jgi:RNA polymerase sigma-70 factor (sigma-E family)
MDPELEFVTFVQTHSAALFRTAFVLTRQRTSAEDLVQETFTKLYPNWSRVANAEVPLAYVRRAMINTFLNGKRASGNREVLFAQSPDRVGDPDPAIGVSNQDQVRQLLDRLPPRPRAVLVLRYLHDLSDAEIAADLGCRQATVRSIASRALNSLRTESSSHLHRTGTIEGTGLRNGQ